MSKPLTCDLCLNSMFTEFSDSAYDMKIWRKTHAYDGYAPWVRKQHLDVCSDCMMAIIDYIEATGVQPGGGVRAKTASKRKLAKSAPKTKDGKNA